jgi:hypothetical protein
LGVATQSCVWIIGLVVIALTRRSGATAAYPPQVAPAVQQAWYDDPERPAHKRWSDGRAWRMRDDEHPAVLGLPAPSAGP